jgi:hypothetical protein
VALEVGAAELYVHARLVLSRRTSIVSVYVHLRAEFNLRATCFVAHVGREAQMKIYVYVRRAYAQSQAEHSTLRRSVFLSAGS